MMVKSGTTWNFIALAVSQITAPKQLVLIAEVIMCSSTSTTKQELADWLEETRKSHDITPDWGTQPIEEVNDDGQKGNGNG